MLAITAKLEKQLSHVGVGMHEDHENHVRVQDGYDGESGAVLEHGGDEAATLDGGAQFIGGGDDRGDVRREVVGVHAGHALAVDQQAVTSQNDGRVYSLASPDGAHEVSNAGHAGSTWKSAPKLKGDVSEVKRRQSLEFGRVRPYSPVRSPQIPVATLMMPTRLLRVALVALAVLGVACGDPTLAKATYASGLASSTFYALTGAPASVPTSLSFLTGALHADASFAFDVAFDLDASNRAVILPVRVVAGAVAGTKKRVGLQLMTGGFDALSEVPSTGYDTLNAKTVVPGAVIAIELVDPTACYSSYNLTILTSQLIYAKLVVDSIDVPGRRLFVRSVVDPNCGYRQVMPDSVPTH